jgi:para-nitrobenzyl esterase
MAVVVSVEEGSLEGSEDRGVRRFLGIPYAAPPVAGLRLRSPRRHPGWSGTRPAVAYGPAAPQRLAGMQTWLNDPPPGFDEDCLVLNVWAPAGATAVPVLVWFHGGATRAGHDGAAAIAGERLAREQGIGHAANWGMQDKIAALEWVQRSISAFGGDPAAVTVAGQSSGGTNAILIAQNPDCAGLFHRIIAMSPPLFRPPMFVGIEAAAEYTEALAELCGTTVRGLRDVDGSELVKRELAFIGQSDFARRFGRPRTAPTLDGRLVRDWPHDRPMAPAPLLIGFTRDEARFWYDLKLPDGTVLTSMKPPVDRAELDTELQRLVRLYYAFERPPSAADVVAAHGGAEPLPDEAARIWFEAYSDILFRAPLLHYAARHAQSAPTYVYESAWPLAAPASGTPHAADVPFLFGNAGHPYIAAKIGYGRDAAALEQVTMDAFASFVRTGQPGVTGWRPVSADDRPAAMVATFGDAGHVVSVGPLKRIPSFELWRAYDPRG